MAAAIENKWWSASVLFLLLSVAFFVFSPTRADPDLWGHVKFGEDLFQTGSINRPDPYSFVTENVPWINHEWLSEAIFYLAYDILGTSGLILVKTTAALFLVGLMYWHLRRHGLEAIQSGILVLGSTLFLMLGLSTVRPQLFTYLLFALTLIAVHRAENGQTSFLWFLPFLFALWINLHGGVLAGIGILLLWAMAHFAVLVCRERTAIVLVSGTSLIIHLAVLLTLLATLINPYGIKLVEFLFRTATGPRHDVAEWLPLQVVGQHGVVYLIFVAISVWGILYSRRRHNPAVIALFICTSLLPLAAIRHLPLFAVAIPLLAGEHIVDAWNRLTGDSRSPGENRLRRIQGWLTLVNFIGGIAILIAAFEHFPCVKVPPSEFPRAGVQLLKEVDAKGNMVVQFRWGQYVIWHLGPRVKVSMDGRRETVYLDEVYQQSRNLNRGLDEWDAVLGNNGTSMALVSKLFASFNLLKLKPGWTLAHEDGISGLFVRTGSPLLQRIRDADRSSLPATDAAFCFP